MLLLVSSLLSGASSRNHLCLCLVRLLSPRLAHLEGEKTRMWAVISGCTALILKKRQVISKKNKQSDKAWFRVSLRMVKHVVG